MIDHKSTKKKVFIHIISRCSRLTRCTSILKNILKLQNQAISMHVLIKMNKLVQVINNQPKNGHDIDRTEHPFREAPQDVALALSSNWRLGITSPRGLLTFFFLLASLVIASPSYYFSQSTQLVIRIFVI
jgi:hypothetical protein